VGLATGQEATAVPDRPISRQSGTTSLPELRGLPCSEFLAVADRDAGLLTLLHLRLGTVWHRFFLDAGLLFWAEGSAPDAGDDLLDGEEHLDLAVALRIRGVAVHAITMRDGLLTLEFGNSARLVLRHEMDGTGGVVQELVPGNPGASAHSWTR
jgi:hypothetical protein